MAEYIDEPGILRSTRSDRLLIDGESRISRDAITPPISEGGDDSATRNLAQRNRDEIDDIQNEIIDIESDHSVHTSWALATLEQVGWAFKGANGSNFTLQEAENATYSLTAPGVTEGNANTANYFGVIRVPVNVPLENIGLSIDGNDPTPYQLLGEHIANRGHQFVLGTDGRWNYFRYVGALPNVPSWLVYRTTNLGLSTWRGNLDKGKVYDQVKDILVGGVVDDDGDETITVKGVDGGPQFPARPTHVRSVWGNDGETDGIYADELALIEMSSKDVRVSHSAYDYQYSSDRISLDHNDIALTDWHDVSASYDSSNPGVVWDSDNSVFVSNAVEFTTIADRRVRVSLDLGLVGYLESGDTISLAVTTTGNIKAIPAHAPNSHAAVESFFFSFDNSVHDRHTHVQFDLVFTDIPAVTDTVALAITNNIIASRATAAPIINFSVPQIDHIPTQAYRGHAIGSKLTGGYWEHYRKEWTRQLRSPGQAQSASIADRQSSALVSHVDESPYLIATSDVRAVVITARALGTGFDVSGDPVYVNIWTDIPGVMDPVRLGRTEINARDFETNGVSGVAYGVLSGQRFYVTQGTGSALGYDIEVIWDANLIASRPSITVLQAGMAWFGTETQYSAITTKDPNRLYLVRADP